MKYAGSSGTSTNRQNNTVYVSGNTARKLQPERIEENIPRTHHVHRQKTKAAPMNKGYIAVMVTAILAVCCVLISYVRLQSDITSHVENISTLESKLNELRLSNDETYTKIMSSVDLEEIKRIAVNELGMRYAEEGQVIQYNGEGNDYVRQYSDIPQTP